MRLAPISEADKNWGSLKAQWRRAAENADEDFSTFALGPLAAIDQQMQQGGGKAGLYGLYEGTVPHAFCQVSKLLIPRFEGPVLRARFMTVAPAYEYGSVPREKYGHLLIELFSAMVWLSRDTLAASHILFHLRSPADAQYLAPLQAPVPDSPFERFAINGAWVEADLKMPALEEAWS